MIKGVNRQIVDIPQPESAYFERAIFFVKPEYSSVSEKKLSGKADEIVRSAMPPHSKQNTKKIKAAPLIQLLCGAAAGAVVTALIDLLIG